MVQKTRRRQRPRTRGEFSSTKDAIFGPDPDPKGPKGTFSGHNPPQRGPRGQGPPPLLPPLWALGPKGEILPYWALLGPRALYGVHPTHRLDLTQRQACTLLLDMHPTTRHAPHVRHAPSVRHAPNVRHAHQCLARTQCQTFHKHTSDDSK